MTGTPHRFKHYMSVPLKSDHVRYVVIGIVVRKTGDQSIEIIGS